jgi:hypothetical protein
VGPGVCETSFGHGTRGAAVVHGASCGRTSGASVGQVGAFWTPVVLRRRRPRPRSNVASRSTLVRKSRTVTTTIIRKRRRKHWTLLRTRWRGRRSRVG